jgi:hypothetical protein
MEKQNYGEFAKDNKKFVDAYNLKKHSSVYDDIIPKTTLLYDVLIQAPTSLEKFVEEPLDFNQLKESEMARNAAGILRNFFTRYKGYGYVTKNIAVLDTTVKLVKSLRLRGRTGIYRGIGEGSEKTLEKYLMAKNVINHPFEFLCMEYLGSVESVDEQELKLKGWPVSINYKNKTVEHGIKGRVVSDKEKYCLLFSNMGTPYADEKGRINYKLNEPKQVPLSEIESFTPI